jgi:hypothetical protein
MQRVASLTLLLGAVLLLSWVIAPAAPSPARNHPGAAAFEQASAPAVAEITAEVDRLRARLATPPAYPPPLRDPFRFGPRAEPKHAAAPPPVAEPPAPDLPRVVAILADAAGGAVTRRAALSFGDQVRIVQAGDTIGGFVVRSISADTVELTDPTTGAAYRLLLR